MGTYNVENLFDDIYQGTEYKSYIPGNSQGWDRDMAKKKLDNISRAILKINADILALQEVENKNILAKLAKKTGYPHYSFAKSTNTATGVGIVSKFPIIFTENIKSPKGRFRPALYAKIVVENEILEFVVVHWPSLKNPNKKREEAANLIAPIMKNMNLGIVLGDFNVPFGSKSILSDFWGNIEEPKGWFDPWFGIKERWSHNFFGQKKILDRIILNESLLNDSGYNYVCKSFKPLHEKPFLKDGIPHRWQIKNHGKGKHVGKGFSDHIPLVLRLEKEPFRCLGEKINIKKLFEIPLESSGLFLEKAKVIYVHKNGLILADDSGSIHLFKPGFTLPKGSIIDGYIYGISTYGGMREIRAMHIEKIYDTKVNPLDFMKHMQDLKELKGGDVLSFVEGYVKNNRLQTKFGSISLFSKNKSLLPKDGEFVKLREVRVNEYRGVKELIIEERE